MGNARMRAEALVGKSSSPTVRERVIAELTRIFEDQDRIRGDDEEAESSNDYRQDDHDGIEPTTFEAVQAREDKKIEALKANLLFSPSAVMVLPTDKADINARGQFGYTRLIQAVVDHNTQEVTQLLANPLVNREAKDTSGMTALDKAVMRGYDDIVALFD